MDLKHELAKKLDKYIKEKHTQEECTGFISGFEKCSELFPSEKSKITSDCSEFILKLIANHRKNGMKLLMQCEDDSQDEFDMWEEIKLIDKAQSQYLSCL